MTTHQRGDRRPLLGQPRDLALICQRQGLSEHRLTDLASYGFLVNLDERHGLDYSAMISCARPRSEKHSMSTPRAARKGCGPPVARRSVTRQREAENERVVVGGAEGV